MKEKRMKIVGVLILCMTLISGCASGSDEGTIGAASNAGETIEITFADYGSSVMPTADGYRTAIDYITRESDGRIKINYQPDAVLGSETEMIQQIMDGTMKMGTLGTSTFSKFSSKLEAFQLPFLITDYEKEQIAFDSDEGKALIAAVEEELGVKIVGYMENGIRHFANNVRPIETPADLQDMKLRIVPSTMLQESMNLLGANPTPLNYGEIYTALQNKVIDGEEINITSLYAMKHYETIEYVSEIGMYPFPVLVVFNGAYWDSLSDEDQNIILTGFEEGSTALFDTYLPDYEVEARAACEEAGLTFNVIEDKEAFREKILPVYEKYEAKDPAIKAFIDMIKTLE